MATPPTHTLFHSLSKDHTEFVLPKYITSIHCVLWMPWAELSFSPVSQPANNNRSERSDLIQYLMHGTQIHFLCGRGAHWTIIRHRSTAIGKSFALFYYSAYYFHIQSTTTTTSTFSTRNARAVGRTAIVVILVKWSSAPVNASKCMW